MHCADPNLLYCGSGHIHCKPELVGWLIFEPKSDLVGGDAAGGRGKGEEY